ncbi:MAG: hypothetical protein JXR14_08475 [Paracoccaceae bacterium]
MHKILMLSAVTSLLTVVNAAQAQQAEPVEQADQFEKICSSMVPPVMTFVSEFESIPEAFDNMYAIVSEADQAKLEDVRSTGEAMVEAMKAYRKAWLDACY